MKSQVKLITSLFTLMAASASCSVFAADYDDFAKVTNVTPQVEQINRPRQDCRTEYVQVNRQVPSREQPHQAERSNSGAIIGGIAGAIIGAF